MKLAASFTTEADGAGTPAVAAIDLHVFLAYENLSSALLAAETLGTLSRKDPEGLSMRLSPWSFAALANPEWRTLAESEIEIAHLIVIAACGALPLLSTSLEGWLRTCLAQRCGNRMAVIALVGGDGRRAHADSSRVRAVQRLAQETGCAFFAPSAAEEIAHVL